MGKCKKRSLHKTNSTYFMTRESAVSNIFKMMNDTKKSNRNKKNSKKKAVINDILSTISLFGISAEELSEAGMAYENLKALGSALS